jgi:hypothetical protein
MEMGYESDEECDCHCDESDSKMMMLWHVGKFAKMELLKEKIKKRLEAAQGKKLDKMADFAVEAMNEYHKAKGDMSKKWQEMHEKFESIFKEN